MTPDRRLIYLHGFASGPESSKGRFFQSKFAETGRELELPGLTEGDFENSTVTQQLRFLEKLAGAGPAVLLGSSMGGYLAALFAARHPERVPGVVLLAPAFGLAERLCDSLDEATARNWREQGWRHVFHYGENRVRRIGYSLIADGLQYEEFPDVRRPALIFHGRKDDSVDYRLSARFAESRPNVQLVLFDSDHQLLNVLEPMWERMREFVDRLR